jgi:formamidopyrimidine-DNA glycosylase
METQKLVSEIKSVLVKSIKHRGFSMNTYVDAMGKKGQSQLHSFVYGKTNQPCKICHTLLKHDVMGGRGVVWCKKCQK